MLHLVGDEKGEIVEKKAYLEVAPGYFATKQGRYLSGSVKSRINMILKIVLLQSQFGSVFLRILVEHPFTGR
ncbi:hypothetical protein SAMN05518672_1011242 [Chitinophaga sp. CF118]|nr:hypothetical protein SAMN05518672_1011242 [Chitinophaga sp. CF118]